nr:MAG TPA: hypothetical protein [Caudoviricetes sp.]
MRTLFRLCERSHLAPFLGLCLLRRYRSRCGTS